MKHFVVFSADAHPTVWLINSETLIEALYNYISEDYSDFYKDGTWSIPDGHGGENIYLHPIELIENEEKCLHEWDIREVTDKNWNAPISEGLVGENPWDIQEHIRYALSAKHHIQPGQKPRAFVWYLQDGPLVTFYKRTRKRHPKPIIITERLLLPWKTWPQANFWHGTYNDIVEQMWLRPA